MQEKNNRKLKPADNSDGKGLLGKIQKKAAQSTARPHTTSTEDGTTTERRLDHLRNPGSPAKGGDGSPERKIIDV